MQTSYRFLILFGCLAILLSGCGWHLRGTIDIPDSLQHLELITADGKTEFTQQLKLSLERNGTVINGPASQYKLQIGQLRDDRRTISTSERGKAAEYTLILEVDYLLHNSDGERVGEPVRVSSEKTYLFDENNVVAGFEEQQLLREEMIRELIAQIIRRYQSTELAASPSEPSSPGQ